MVTESEGTISVTGVYKNKALETMEESTWCFTGMPNMQNKSSDTTDTNFAISWQT